MDERGGLQVAWRVVVRFSLDHDASSAIRNRIRDELHQAGIRRTKTGTWECIAASPQGAAERISNVLDILANPAQVNGSAPNVSMDHLWVYMDKVDLP